MVLLKENWRIFSFFAMLIKGRHVLSKVVTFYFAKQGNCSLAGFETLMAVLHKKEETLISRNQDSVKSHNLWHFSHELSLRARLRGLSRSQKSCDLQSLTLYTPKWAIIGCPFFTLQFAPMISLHTGQKYKFKNGNLKMPATSTKKYLTIIEIHWK